MPSQQDRINVLEKELEYYKNKLDIETAKNKIYIEIIKNNTSIKLDEHFKDTNKVIKKEDPVQDTKEHVQKEHDFEEFFGKLQTYKTVQTRPLKDIKTKMSSLMQTMSLDCYIKLCKDNVARLISILTDKNVSDKKQITHVSKILTTIDKRLIRHKGYVDEHIDVEELSVFQQALINQGRRIDTKLFNVNKICEQLRNYGIVLFSIEKNLERVLISESTNVKIIYLKSDKSTSKSPFSFYTLNSSENNIKKWKMDCRLEHITTEIISIILPYALDLFKKIYKDVFGDNDYRVDFVKKCQVTECDCQQLIKNIFVLCNQEEMCTIIKNIIVKNNTHVKEANDVFNVLKEDKTTNTINNSVNIYSEVSKNMFTSIEDNEIEDFISVHK